MNAKLLDQIGLIVGFVSGLLLIPEILNLIPLARLEKSIENRLHSFENWMRFPLRFSPPSWRAKYTEQQREAIEPITAVRSLIFSMVWIALLITGLFVQSLVLVIISLIIVIVVVVGNIMKHIPMLPQLTFARKIGIFFGLLLILTLFTPLISLLRVILLIMRKVVSIGYNFFSSHDVIRSSLIIMAVLLFILSNILQFVATLQ